MKKMLSIALVTTLAFLPALSFANEGLRSEAVPQNEEGLFTPEEGLMMSDEMAITEADDVNAEFRRWVCYARDWRGNWYVGRDWDRGDARRKALRHCQRSIRFGYCRLAGCDRRGW